MKFSTATVAISLVLGALSSSNAFFVNPAVQRHTISPVQNSALSMVATNEVVNGEQQKQAQQQKPRRTREVGVSLLHIILEIFMDI